jgi:hypothetical protein
LVGESLRAVSGIAIVALFAVIGTSGESLLTGSG